VAHLVKGSVDSAGPRGVRESVCHRRVGRTGCGAGHRNAHHRVASIVIRCSWVESTVSMERTVQPTSTRWVVRTGAAGNAGVVRIEWAGSEAAHLLN